MNSPYADEETHAGETASEPTPEHEAQDDNRNPSIHDGCSEYTDARAE